MVFDYITIFIYGVVAGLAASILLGPIGVLCVQRTLSNSRRAGFVSGLGAATADTIFATLAIFALSWVEGIMERYQIWVEVGGGLLIMLLGISIFFKKPQRSTEVHKEKGKSSDLTNYFSVLFLSLPNPAYFVIFTLIFAAMGIGAAEFVAAQKWILILGIFCGASGWWFVLTFVVNKFRKRFTMHSLLWLNKITGGVIALLGAFTVIAIIYKLIKMLVETGAVKI